MAPDARVLGTTTRNGSSSRTTRCGSARPVSRASAGGSSGGSVSTSSRSSRPYGAARVDRYRVLLHTGGDTGWTTPAYAEQAPYLTRRAARWLADRAPALVGIDAVNIDDLHDQTRRAHSVLLAVGVLVRST